MFECAYINKIANVLSPKYARLLNMAWQMSEYGKVLNMQALHNVLNMPEYALTKF